MTALRRRALPLVATAGLLAGLAGCGQGSVLKAPATPAAGAPGSLPAASPEPATTGPGLVRDGEPLVTCGPAGPLPASVLRDGVPGLVERADVLAALDELRGREDVESSQLLLAAASAADVPHRVVGVAEEAAGRDVVVLLGALPTAGERPELDVVLLDEQDGRWRARGFGGCEVQPVLPAGEGWAEIGVPPQGLDRSTTALMLAVSELSCASGRDPGPFLREPVVVEDDVSVVVSWTAEVPRGAQNCIGRAPIVRQVPLAEPLGDRALLDGRTWPPIAVAGAGG